MFTVGKTNFSGGSEIQKLRRLPVLCMPIICQTLVYITNYSDHSEIAELEKHLRYVRFSPSSILINEYSVEYSSPFSTVWLHDCLSTELLALI